MIALENKYIYLSKLARNCSRPVKNRSLRTHQHRHWQSSWYSTKSAKHFVAENARTDSKTKIKSPQSSELPPLDPANGFGAKYNQPTLKSLSLEGKVAVVTGGARGLGLVMAQGLQASGAEVAIVDLNENEAKLSAEEMTKIYKVEASSDTVPPKVSVHKCDVSSESSVSSALDSVVKMHSKIDILVTSAGFTENFSALDYPADRLNAIWAVNINGSFFWSRAVARHLLARQSPGSIIMIGSMSGVAVNIPQPQAPYNASKAAVRQMAASLAVEWAKNNIRVNCVSPGYMLTALTQKILEERPDFKEKWNSLIPMGRMGIPTDLQGVITFLASDASSYVTGADFRVDGGYTVV